MRQGFSDLVDRLITSTTADIGATEILNLLTGFKLGLLRGIVNHSYSKLQRNSDWNESQIEDNSLRDTNRYEVLEKYDEVENEVEIGTKVRFE